MLPREISIRPQVLYFFLLLLLCYDREGVAAGVWSRFLWCLGRWIFGWIFAPCNLGGFPHVYLEGT